MIFGIAVALWGLFVSIMDLVDPTYDTSDGLVLLCLGVLLFNQAEDRR